VVKVPKTTLPDSEAGEEIHNERKTKQPLGGTILKKYQQFIVFLNSVGTLGIVGLMIIINADVFGRELFSRPIKGVPEIVRLVIVGIVFIQGAHTVASDRMTCSEMLLKTLSKHLPFLYVIVQALFNLMAALLFAVICYGTWFQLIQSWENDDFIGSMGIFTAPVWPINFVILLGSGLMAIQYLIAIYRTVMSNSRQKSEV
jgi:TRAP-type C4-dicarboxylate transport system permease small subunit